MNPLFGNVFQELDAAGIRYCILRLPGDPGNECQKAEEYDILVDPWYLVGFGAVAVRAGFLPRYPRAAGHHNDFIQYDSASGNWLKLDVVTALRYGRYRLLEFPAAPEFLQLQNSSHEPPLEARFLKILLHCVLHRGTVDGSAVEQIERLYSRLQSEEAALRRAISYADRWLAPALLWPAIATAVESGHYQDLLGRRRRLLWHFFWITPFHTAGRFILAPFAALRRRISWRFMSHACVLPHQEPLAMFIPESLKAASTGTNDEQEL